MLAHISDFFSCKLVEIQDLVLAILMLRKYCCMHSKVQRKVPILGGKDKRKPKRTEVITICSLLIYFSWKDIIALRKKIKTKHKAVFIIYFFSSPHLYIILGSHNQGIGKPCVSPPNEVFPRAQTLAQSWVDIGVRDSALVLGLWPHSRPFPNSFSCLHPPRNICTQHPHYTAVGTERRGIRPLWIILSIFQRSVSFMLTAALQGKPHFPFPTEVETEAQNGGRLFDSETWDLGYFQISLSHVSGPATCLIPWFSPRKYRVGENGWCTAPLRSSSLAQGWRWALSSWWMYFLGARRKSWRRAQSGEWYSL